MAKAMRKLVRDNIPAIIRANGEIPITRVLGDKEYITELVKKLKEETEEFAEAYSPEELADLFEVLLAIRTAIGLTESELEEIRKKKAHKNGSFKERLFLKSVQ